MLQFAGDLCFADQVGGILAGARTQCLDGDLAVELGILCQIYRALHTPAQFADDVETTDHLVLHLHLRKIVIASI
jgi:hypothetical protein